MFIIGLQPNMAMSSIEQVGQQLECIFSISSGGVEQKR